MIDREALVKSRLAERVVELPGVGAVRIRSLSGKEVSQIPERRDKEGTDATEEFVLTRAVIDPVLSPSDVRAWREAAPHAELLAVLSEIFELSGLGDDAMNEAAKSFRDRPVEEA